MKHSFSIRLFFILFCAGAFCSGYSQDNKSYGTMRGNDGKTYKTVKIGNQVWMAENLRETKYRNGDLIPEVTEDAEWIALSTDARCVYANNESNADIGGYLYNWYAAVDKRNIASEGWHVPTDDDWKELETALGMSRKDADKDSYRGSDEGSKLAGNASYWIPGDLKNHSAFGTSGFSALPAGYRLSSDGYFFYLGYRASFWSATELSNGYAWCRHLSSSGSGVHRYVHEKQGGFSIRLLRD